MNQTIKIAILICFIIFCPGISLIASEGPENLFYLTEEFRPYNYMENGELKGLSVDILKLIWHELGIKPQKVKLYPWARAYHMLKNNMKTVLFSTAKTEDRAKLFKWVGPISNNTKTVFISLKTNQLIINSIEEAKNYKIGTIRNDAAEQILFSMGFNNDQIKPVSNLILNIKKINVGRIDLIAFDEVSFHKILKTNGISSENYETVFVVKETMNCYAFSKDVSDNLVKKFQNALDKIKQRSEYQKLLETYFQ